MRPRVTAFGESALFVELGDVFDESLAAWARALADEWPLGTAVPAYASVTATFDTGAVEPEVAERRMRDLVERGPTFRANALPAGGSAGSARVVEIPTRYDGEDLADVARLSRLSVDELIKIHSEREYAAIFLGFLPGFAYCGRLDPRVVAPRLERPRDRVPAGAVAVADSQTGVYPFASPGGWRLIGVTDLVMFDPEAVEPATIRAGDRVRFVPR
ncbi:MAG: 5-oxoprolinase subunit PxpB [Chloroflexota bacterium]|nr:5-oxoprolinase subunit PxpB [Chloroflexota bacterium]